MKSFVKTVVFAGLGVGCLALGSGAQTPPPPAPTPPAPTPILRPAIVTEAVTAPPAVPGVPGAVGAGGFTARSGDRLIYMAVGDASHAEAVKLAKQITEAKGDSEKEKLREKLRDVLGKSFDARQKHHEKEIESLEAQVKKLKELVAKRQENKKEIIEERVRQLQREAQGLGW